MPPGWLFTDDMIQALLTNQVFMLGVGLILLVIVWAYLKKRWKLQARKTRSRSVMKTARQLTSQELDWAEYRMVFNLMPYKPKRVLTKAEAEFYKDALLPYAEAHGFEVFAKPKLEDFVYVDGGRSLDQRTHSRAQREIGRKHVDFLVIDPETIYTLFAIEYDDASHKQIEAYKNDEFKNALFEKIGIRLVRIEASNQWDEFLLEERLQLYGIG